MADAGGEDGTGDGPVKKGYRTFGRRVGPSLSPRQKALVARELPRLAVPLGADAAGFFAALRRRGFDSVILEIGFGGGEHLLHNARMHPGIFFLGAEPFLNGVVKLIDTVVAEDVANLAVHHGDVRDLIEWLPDGVLARVDMLYPDPWPKLRHHKRRLFARDLLSRIAPKMDETAPFRFASDIPHYVEWALKEAKASGLFVPQSLNAADLATPYPGWPGTRYEQKALREGRVPQYLTFVKTGGR